MLEFSKLPLRALRYTVTVRELGRHDCTVDWYVDYEPAGDSEELGDTEVPVTLIIGETTKLAIELKKG